MADQRYFPSTVACTVMVFSLLTGVAAAQIKPATSGKTSFYEPEMRAHGPGEVRPNMPGKPVVGHSRHRRARRMR